MNTKKLILYSVLVSSFCQCSPKQKAPYFEEGLKEINGTNLYYKVIGSGEPILVIHGGPGLSHDYFLPALAPLNDTYRLTFYDQRASGRSDLGVSPESVTLDSFIKDINELREAFGLEKVNLMAHSWGWIPAMKYALKYPGNMKSLILVSSVGASSELAALSNAELARRFTREDSINRSQILSSEEFQAGSGKSVESLMKIGFRHQFYTKTYLDSLHLAIDDNFMTSSGLLQNLGKDLGNFDFHSDLKNIQCPTLLIYGSYDPLTQLAGSRIHDAIEHSELDILDDCGHFPFIEKQDEFNEALIEFMDTLE